MSTNTARIAIWVNEIPTDGVYEVSAVKEGEPGHTPLNQWPTLDAAKKYAAAENGKLGVSERDVTMIVASSMAASSREKAERETITVVMEVRITDQDVQDIIDIANYGGIQYWSTPAGIDGTVEDGFDLYEAGGYEDPEYRSFTATDVRNAVKKLLDPSNFVNVSDTIRGYVEKAVKSGFEQELDGIDCGEIDSDAADVIIQLAALGEVRYG